MTELHRRALLKLSVAGAIGYRAAPLEPSSADQTGGWPSFQYDAANTGYNPTGTAPTDGLTEERTYDTEFQIGGSPVIADGTLFVGESPWDSDAAAPFWAFDTADGSTKWRVDGLKIPDIDSAVVVSNGTLFTTDKDQGRMYATDPATGETQWSREVGSGAITYDNANEVVFCNGYGLDPETGETRWTAQTSVNEYLGHAARDGFLYLVNDDGGLVAISSQDGSEQWRATDNHTNPPTVTDQGVYAAIQYNKIRAYDPTDGSVLWTSPKLSSDLVSSVVTTGNSVYVSYGEVTALSVTDGSILWQVEPDPKPYSTPVLVDDVLYVPAGSQDQSVILALDPTDGSEITRVGVSTVGDVVAVADGEIFTGSEGVSQVTGAAGDVSLSLTLTDDTAEAGGTAVIDFILTNNGGAESTGIDGVLDPPPGNWKIIDAGGFSSLSPGETETASVELAVPEVEAGEYVFEGLVEDDSGNEASDTSTVTVEGQTKISVTDARLLQLAENTRPSDSPTTQPVVDNSELAGQIPDWSPEPDLVEGKRTVPLFDIEADESPENVDTPVEVTISRNTAPDHSFVVKAEYVSTALENAFLTQLAEEFPTLVPAEDPDSTYPVFNLSEDLSEVTIEISPLADGYEGDSKTISSVSSTSMPSLDVAFVVLSDVEDNTSFTEVGVDTFLDEVDSHLPELQALFPTATVNAYVHTDPVALESNDIWDLWYFDSQRANAWEVPVEQAEAGDVTAAGDGPPQGDILVAEDGKLVESTRDTGDHTDLPHPPEDLQLDEFDGVVAFCPPTFVSSFTGATNGVEKAGASGQAALVNIEAGASTTPHELTHHFLGFYDQEGYADDEMAHAADSIVSTVVRPPAGGANIPLDTVDAANSFAAGQSYMRSAGSGVGMDTLNAQELIDNEFVPESASAESSGTVVSFFATVDDAGMTVQSVKESQTLPPTDDPDGDATVTAYHSNGQPLETISLQTGASPGVGHGDTVDPGPSAEDQTVVAGRVPFPEATADIQVTAPSPSGEDVSTRVNPHTQTLQETLQALPAEAFVGSPTDQRQAMLDLLDDAATAMDEKEFVEAKSAFETLQSEIESNIGDTYDPTAANRPSKQELLDTVDDRLDRAGSLIEQQDGPPVIVGGSGPQDLDGDGLYRDIDGDGTFDLHDVRLFFENLNEPVIQYNSAFFNFDESTPAEADLDDVRALYQAYLDSQPTLDTNEIEVSEMSAADFERLFRTE